MSKQDKIEISFNEVSYKEKLRALELNVKKVNHCLDCIEHISGNRLLITLPEIEKLLTDRTGFSNIGASAELLNLYTDYIFLEAHLPTLETKNLEFDGNLFKIKESLLNDLKESCTNYLSDEFISDYNNLKKAAEYLNKLTSPALVKCLSSDYKGTYTINLIALENSKLVC